RNEKKSVECKNEEPVGRAGLLRTPTKIICGAHTLPYIMMAVTFDAVLRKVQNRSDRKPTPAVLPGPAL
ncbi:hypothetical protein GWI33_003799, partial [Rhynchophorus ferrugineus]